MTGALNSCSYVDTGGASIDATASNDKDTFLMGGCISEYIGIIFFFLTGWKARNTLNSNLKFTIGI